MTDEKKADAKVAQSAATGSENRDNTPGQVNDNVAGHPAGFNVNRTNLPSKQNQNRPGAVNNDVAGHPAGFPVQSTVPGPLETATSEKTAKGDYNTKDPNFKDAVYQSGGRVDGKAVTVDGDSKEKTELKNGKVENVGKQDDTKDDKKDDGSFWSQKGPQDEKVQSADAKKAQDKGGVKKDSKTEQTKEAEKGADHEKDEKPEEGSEDAGEGDKEEKKAQEDADKVEEDRKKKNPGLFEKGGPNGEVKDKPKKDKRLECKVPKDLGDNVEEAYMKGHAAGLKKAKVKSMPAQAQASCGTDVDAAFRLGHDDALRAVEGDDVVPVETPVDSKGHELDAEGRVHCDVHPQALISPGQECPDCNADKLGGHTAHAGLPKFHTDAAGQLEGVSKDAVTNNTNSAQ